MWTSTAFLKRSVSSLHTRLLCHFISFFMGTINHYVRHAMLVGPNKVETAVHGCQHDGSLFHRFFFLVAMALCHLVRIFLGYNSHVTYFIQSEGHRFDFF